jgi:hypothetical protein
MSLTLLCALPNITNASFILKTTTFFYLACSISTLSLLLHINPTAAVALHAIYHNAEVALGLPLGTNTLATSLIIGQIWYLARYTPDTLKVILAAIAVVIESGALAVVTQLASCVLTILARTSQCVQLFSAMSDHFPNISICITHFVIITTGYRANFIILHVGMENSIKSSMGTNITTVNFIDPASG